jgi:predicted nucleic acid-binding Zn ribbon protein
MPMHSYKCRKCTKEYEVFYTSQSAVEAEEPKEKCKHCGSKSKKRLPPKGTSHILKGSGWYKDGYGK